MTEAKVKEGRRAVGDRRQDGYQTGKVEPARVVAGFHTAELRCPPVNAPGGRKGRYQFRHAQTNDQDEDRDQRPADRDGNRSSVVPPEVEGGEATGQDRNDREGDGEVREP